MAIESDGVGGLIAKRKGNVQVNKYVFFLDCSGCGYTDVNICQSSLNSTLKICMFILY